MTPTQEIDLLKRLSGEDEAIATFSHTGSYCLYQMIIPTDKPFEHLDLAACLEDTLHRLLDDGQSDDVIASVLGARQESADDAEDEVTYIDLGYIIPGLLMFASPERSAS